MSNLKLITIALIALFVASSAFAVSAEEGDFIVLGREVDGIFMKGMVDLFEQPGALDVVRVQIKSGTAVQVVEKAELENDVFYLVSTVGRDGGLMGWVTEDYIYEITVQPEE